MNQLFYCIFTTGFFFSKNSQYVSFKDRLTELSVDHAIIEHDLRRHNEDLEDLEQSLKVYNFILTLAVKIDKSIHGVAHEDLTNVKLHKFVQYLNKLKI